MRRRITSMPCCARSWGLRSKCRGSSASSRAARIARPRIVPESMPGCAPRDAAWRRWPRSPPVPSVVSHKSLNGQSVVQGVSLASGSGRQGARVKVTGAGWMLLLGVVIGAAQAAPELKMDLPDWKRTAVEDRDLGHGVHMLESFGGNIGVLAGDEEVLLTDAKWPQLNDKVVAAVGKISPQPIRYLVNTHWHWDHVGGDGLFGKAGVVIFSSEQTRAHIVQAQKQ